MIHIHLEEDAAAVKLEQVCHQNLATCLLKLSAPSEALLHCHKALKLDREGTAWKARLRMGEAYLQLGRHDEAKEVFQVGVSQCVRMFYVVFFFVVGM